MTKAACVHGCPEGGSRASAEAKQLLIQSGTLGFHVLEKTALGGILSRFYACSRSLKCAVVCSKQNPSKKRVGRGPPEKENEAGKVSGIVEK